MKKNIYIIIGILIVIFLNIFLFQSFSEKEKIDEPIVQPNAKPTISPVYTVSIPPSINFSGENAPLDIFYVREYLDRELTVNTYFHSSTILLFKKANRWFPVIEPILKENNIPDDFKYLALIESGLENVGSPAGAKGFWQFLKHTAREYGLEVNSGVDERYNVEKSTEAACKYLKNSFEKYNNWTLVAAAYNAGNRRISGELKKQNVNSYYDLLLNQETTRYVFRILAIKNIFENPEDFGFFINEMDLYPPIPTQTVTVDETIKNLVEFSDYHNINYKTLKYFNPWLRKDYLPNRSGRTYHLKIPKEGIISLSAIKEKTDVADIGFE